MEEEVAAGAPEPAEDRRVTWRPVPGVLWRPLGPGTEGGPSKLVVGPGAEFRVDPATGGGTLAWQEQRTVERRGFRPRPARVTVTIQKGVYACTSFPESSSAPSPAP